jgi:Glycosyltransferase family 87
MTRPPAAPRRAAERLAPVELDLPRKWVVRAAWIALAAAVVLVVVAAVAVKPLDFSAYRWGGQEVAHGLRLYLTRFVQGHDKEWFTYPPFAAVVFVPVAAIPAVMGQVAWQLVSVLALAGAAVTMLRMAGYRPSRSVVAATVVIGFTLEPIYHTLYLGQVNLILLALILTDVWRAARGRTAGVGVGIAAAIKLTPLIFIPLFLLARRPKAAVIAAATFAGCALIGYLVAPAASDLYWHHLFDDTKRVGAPYISNQSPYAAAVRIAGSAADVGHWYLAVPLVLGAGGLLVAAVLARHDDWLGAATTTGATSLLVSPISWTHHWVWILPALVTLLKGGKRSRIAAVCAYVLFVLAPMWFTPRGGGPGEYGFHGLLTLVANCYLIAGLAFLGYMASRAYLIRGHAAAAAVSANPSDRAGAVPARRPRRTAAGRSPAAARIR